MSEQLETAVAISVNGAEVAAAQGQLLIDACEQAGVYIPRFCYHPRMRSVGMCRMCLVEVDTGRGPALQPSCMVEVSEGMTVETESPASQKAQEGVLEFLLVNHPLDCPVCDKGGECPLQDQTMAFGPGESRFVEPKRHFAKPIPISSQVYLDRERCILCDRCTRFASEVAGDPLIHFMDRGSTTEVNTFPDAPFSSYFSGNTVQICPVGALTASPYRFKARPWDLAESDSTFPNPMGDRIVVESSRDQILRYQGMDSDAVNWGWLSDRDRFSFQAGSHPDRLSEPLMRDDAGNLAPVAWNAALDAAAGMVAAAVETLGPQSVAVIGGAHLTCEAQYAWAKLAKAVWGTDNVDTQLDDGLDAEVVLGLPRATVNQACAAGGTVILVAADPKEELGTLYLRLRPAVEAGDVTLLEITPTATGLSDVAARSLRVLPGDAPVVFETLLADDPIAHARASGTPEDGKLGITAVSDIAALSELLREKAGDADVEANADSEKGFGEGSEAGGGAGSGERDGEGSEMIGGGVGSETAVGREDKSPLTVIFGRSSLAESPDVIASVAAQIAKAYPHARFLPALRRGNVHGALEMGLAPGLLPGRTPLDGDGNWYRSIWGSVPAEPGEGADGIITKAAAGEIAVLVCLGADPVSDFPNKQLISEALAVGTGIIAIDAFANSTVEEASIVLPAAAFGEREGTHMNLEGRLSPVAKQVNPPGTARSDWMIATELARRGGIEWDFASSEDIWEEIAEIVPRFKDISVEAVRNAPDGVLMGDADSTGSQAADSSQAIGADSRGITGSGTATSIHFDIPTPEPTPHDRYAFRLVVNRTLYDNGTLVSHCPSLAPLAEPAAACLNPAAVRELGISDGDTVSVASTAGKISIPVTADARVPEGVVVIPHNHSDADPRELIVNGSTVTEVRISTVAEGKPTDSNLGTATDGGRGTSVGNKGEEWEKKETEPSGSTTIEEDGLASDRETEENETEEEIRKEDKPASEEPA